jgi:hypothetical protein
MTDTNTLCFDDADFEKLAAPGLYTSTIVTTRFHTSEQGNETLQVVHELEGLTPGSDRVAEYFVLDGGSPRGRALSRRRLVGLYRACGFAPVSGHAIDPTDLLDARLEVRVEHDDYQGRPRLRVAAHRPLGSGPARASF